jgi:hypothetical protein
MKKSRTRKKSILLELFFDATLLLLFIGQAFIAGCLLAYGHIPIPKEWANTQLAQQTVYGFHLQAESFRLKLNGNVELAGLIVINENIRQPVLEADGAIIECQLLKDGALHFNIQSLLLSNGTLYLPAVYAPDGKRTALLERIALHLEPIEALIRVDSFAARHEDIHLRGAIEWPSAAPPAPLDELDPVGRFFQTTAKALKEKVRFSPFKNPTLTFDLSMLEDRSVRILTQLSCREFKNAEAFGSNFRLNADLRLKDGHLSSGSPILTQVDTITVPRFDITAKSLSAQIEKDNWKELLNPIWPEFKISAHSLTAHGIALDSPYITVRPQNFPLIRFAGSTNGFKGAVAFEGEIDTAKKNGRIGAKGNVDLMPLIPPATLAKIPKILFESAPYCDLTLNLSEGFGIGSAHFDCSTSNLNIADITVDYLRARGTFSDGIFSLEEVAIQRSKQWIDLQFDLDTNTAAFRIALIGSAVPGEYNALLPGWWAAIFKDFEFEHNYQSYGDFVIDGNTKQFGNGSFFGRVQVGNIKYKEVPIDSADLIVRGRDLHVQLHNMDVTSGRGWAHGDISFTSVRDEVPAPISIRYDLKSKLPPLAAQKIFGGSVASLIDDFLIHQLPIIELKGVSFNTAYPQYSGRSTFHLSADSPGKIAFKNLPLDHLHFTLTRHETITYLRDVTFGYADGTGTAMVDILTPPNQASELRLNLSLHDADATQSIRDLPRLNSAEDSLGNYESNSISRDRRDEGRLNLNLQAQGPIDNPYQFNGYGSFTINDKKLGAIQLFGPLSSLLKNTRFNFTSLDLHSMAATFRIAANDIRFYELRIDGPQTRINADGNLKIKPQALDMRVQVNLFANVGAPDSPLRKFGNFLTNPLANLLEFQLTGTIQEQKWRSAYDPRKLIPNFKSAPETTQ